MVDSELRLSLAILVDNHLAKLTRRELSVFLVMLKNSDHHGRVHLSCADIASRIGSKFPESVRSPIKSLCNKGLVTTEQNDGGKLIAVRRVTIHEVENVAV